MDSVARRRRSTGWAAVVALSSGLLLLSACSNDLGPAAVPAGDEPSSVSASTTTPPATSISVLGTTQVVEPGIFVSPDGSDSAAGTREAPLRTTDEALSRWNGVDPIVLLPGTYPQLDITGVLASSTAPLVVRADAPGTVTVAHGSLTDKPSVKVWDSIGVVVRDLEIRDGLWGISVQRSSEVTLANNEIHEIGQEGVHIRDFSHDVLISGNLIHHTGQRTDRVGNYPVGHAPGEGIYLGTGSPSNQDEVHSVEIVGNEIHTTTHEAIDIKVPVHDVLVRGNYIHDIDTFVTGAFVVHLGARDTPPANIWIDANVIHSVTRSSEHRDGNCLVVDTAARITNNVIFDCQHRGIFVRDGVPNGEPVDIIHNTLFDTGSVAAVDVHQNSNADLTVINNLGVEGEGNRTASTSDFVNAASGDFRLAFTSGAIDGAVVTDIAVDLDGRPRPSGAAPDFGAHEVQVTEPSTPPTTSGAGASTTSTTVAAGSSTTSVEASTTITNPVDVGTGAGSGAPPSNDAPSTTAQASGTSTSAGPAVLADGDGRAVQGLIADGDPLADAERASESSGEADSTSTLDAATVPGDPSLGEDGGAEPELLALESFPPSAQSQEPIGLLKLVAFVVVGALLLGVGLVPVYVSGRRTRT